jgi:hypothetical protein
MSRTAVVLIGLFVAGGALASLGSLAMRRRRRENRGRGAVGVILADLALVTVLAFGIIQLVPYGRDQTNPPITGEPAWSSPRTRELMVNACYGCHSNEVEWPWYASVAPISWLVHKDVAEGRDAVNYSEFATDRGEADETIEVILDGSMPPRTYTMFGLHPEADLSDAETAELLAGLRATPGLVEHDDERGEDGGDLDRDD